MARRKCRFETRGVPSCMNHAAAGWTMCKTHYSAGRSMMQHRMAKRAASTRLGTPTRAGAAAQAQAACASTLGTTVPERRNDDAPTMTGLDRLRAQTAALFLLELLARDEQAQGNGEQFACYAQAIMAVRKVTKDEPR